MPPRSGLWLAAFAVVGALGCGPSAQRLQCLDFCETNNSSCIAQASTGPALQSCSSWTSQCVAQCPP
ncbi:MAG TPA: hypothetical protein VHL80_08365 [Polyangia bacterium]|nr:hypothetical protein [Polyangia bacterium]